MSASSCRGELVGAEERVSNAHELASWVHRAFAPGELPSSVIRDTVAEQEIDVFDKRLAVLSKTATDSDNDPSERDKGEKGGEKVQGGEKAPEKKRKRREKEEKKCHPPV